MSNECLKLTDLPPEIIPLIAEKLDSASIEDFESSCSYIRSCLKSPAFEKTKVNIENHDHSRVFRKMLKQYNMIMKDCPEPSFENSVFSNKWKNTFSAEERMANKDFTS